MAVDAGNFRGSRCAAKNKLLKMCIFGTSIIRTSYSQAIDSQKQWHPFDYIRPRRNFINHAEFLFLYKRSKHLSIFWYGNQSFRVRKLNEQSDRHASVSSCSGRLRILPPKNPNFWWIFQFSSVIVTSIRQIKQTFHQVPGSMKKHWKLNISLKM